MDNHHIYQALPAMGRSNAAPTDLSPPNRASTTPQQATERPHRHQRLHASSLVSKGLHGSGNHHYHRHRATESVPSATTAAPPSSIDHFLRRDRRSPERRGSENGQDSRNVSEHSDAPQLDVERKTPREIKPEDVVRAKAQNIKREEELSRTLKSVEEIGMKSTRDLDNTYYSILEKVSVLQGTIAALQQLSNESRDLHTRFDKDASELERSSTDSLKAFTGFEGQERTVGGLVDRLKDSKTKTERLNERLELARSRVEAYEKREKEAYAKRRTRWRITWGTLGGVVVLIAALLVVRHHRDVRSALDDVGGRLGEIRDLIENTTDPFMAAMNQSDVTRRTTESEDDSPLHALFDAL